LTVNFLPDRSFAQVEEQVLSWSKTDPRKTIRRLTSQFVVQRLADALCDEAGIAPDATPAELPRETRRKLVHALVERPLPVVGSRGFRYAEATAGGVPLSEVNPSTLESRRCPGLFLAGEILDVDGRIGGFNFQWAWSSASVAARGMAARDYGKWSPFSQ
jgi:predicted Rossmann fold flavoprotein